VTQTAANEMPSKKKTKKTIASSGGNDAETASSQSSEFPPFFVEHPKHDWLFENDWLKKEAFKFKQGDKELFAYPQGRYLKRVEQVCSERIKAINHDRINKPPKA
jgi:hypothetical protein